jgi:uncharacterized protein (TIGR02996 family)
MSDETEFLRAILAAPADDAPRLAFAQRLAERGAPRGEFIRVQCRVARLSVGDPELTTLQKREAELLQAHYTDWTQELAREAPGAWGNFRRGFLDTLTVYDANDETLGRLTACSTVRTMELDGRSLGAAGLRHLQSFPLLEQLDLANLMLTDDGLCALAVVRSLRVLSLNLDGLTADGLAHLEALPELLVIRHEQEPLPEVSAALGSLKRLRMERFRRRPVEVRRQEGRLVLESHGGSFDCEGDRVKSIRLTQCWVTDIDLEYLTAFPEVEVLDLYETWITSAGLEHLAGLSNLRELTLAKSHIDTLTPLTGLLRLTRLRAWSLQDREYRNCLTDEGTEGLERLVYLEDLDLAYASITDATLHRIARLTSLHRLQLIGGTFTDAGLEQLRGLRQLEELRLGFCRDLTNAGLHHLSVLTSLKVLSVGGPGISDAGLVHVHGMQGLECLEVFGTQMTAGGAQRLLEVLPGVSVGVGNSIVKRVPEVVRFQRREFGGRASIALPQDWDVVQWHTYGPAGQECFHGEVIEDGYRHRLSYSSESAPARVWLYSHPAQAGQSAADVVEEHLEHDEAECLGDPDVDVQRLPDTDSASRRFETRFGRKLLCVWSRGGSRYEVVCEAPAARWALREPLFALMAGSFWFAEDGPGPEVGPVVRPSPVVPRRPPTEEEELLRQAIATAPGEDGPRLRYAGWLTNRGDPLGEFIRVQVDREGCADPGQRRVLLAKERQLREAHEAEWLRPLQALGLTDVVFRRGLVEVGTVGAMTFVDRGTELFAAAPALHRLRLRWVGSALPALVRSPLLARLTELDFRHSEVTAGEWAELLTSPHLAGLRELEGCGNRFGPEAALAVARATQLRLTRLDMCCNGLGDDGLEVLAGAPHLASLTVLDLAGNDLTERGARALAASSHLTGLTQLKFSGKRFGAAALALLARATNLGGLRELYLHQCPIEDAGLHELARSTCLTRLEMLDISGGDWTDEGIKVLAESAVVGGLAWLNLSCSNLSAAGLRAVVQSSRLENLRKLDVGGNAFGDDGVAALVESSMLGRLTYLNAANTGLTAEGVRRLTATAAIANLRTLYLGANRIGDAGLEALLSCPYLDRIEHIDVDYNETGRGAMRAFRERFRDQVERW